jgi:lysine 2,3-aminomutase
MTIKQIDTLFCHLPEFKEALLKSDSPEVARNKLLSLLEHLIENNVDDVCNLSGLQFSLRLSCARVIRQFLAKRTARITGFDMVKELWLLARKREAECKQPLSEAFFVDLSKIFAGLAGHAEVYEVEESDLQKGRAAAIERSELLNEIFINSENLMKKYPSGLDEAIAANRQKNAARIMEFFKVDQETFSDYSWQLKNIVRNVDVLEKLVYLSNEEKQAISKARELGLPFGITPYYVSLFENEPGSDIDRAIRAQVIPGDNYIKRMAAGKDNRREKFDFMREGDTSPIDLVTRRYSRIAIFKPYNACSQICVYCQRNWEIEDAYIPQALAPREKIDEAIAWFAKNPALTEILVTGGDPLVMKDEYIEYILDKLSEIESIRRIRLGTRTPVVLPQRFTDNLIRIISRHHVPGRREISIVTHFEHSLEVTPEAMHAAQKIRKCGMGIYNQAVFTMYNSRKFELAALRKSLRLIGVDPYYTFNAKGKEETEDFRVPLARLQQEAKEEARLLPGIERTDEPVYNVPGLGKNYLRAEQNHLLLTIMPDGRRIYEFHPWEKLIRHARSYIHADVPIYTYLQRLIDFGENIEDYKTIFYYF